MTKFIKEVCVPLRKTFKERIADNKLDYFSKSYSARNYNGFVFDRYFETDASFVLFVCNRDGDCYVHFSFDDDSNTFYEIPIYWTLKKNKIEFEYYLEEVNVEI